MDDIYLFFPTLFTHKERERMIHRNVLTMVEGVCKFNNVLVYLKYFADIYIKFLFENLTK